MIFLLETPSKKVRQPKLLATLARGVIALVVLVAGVFTFTVAATAVLVIGGLVAVGGAIWWQIVGKRRVAELMQRHAAQFGVSESAPKSDTAVRTGVVIEGELVK